MKSLLKIIITISFIISSSIALADSSCTNDIDKCTQSYYRHPNLNNLSQIIDGASPSGSKQPLQSFATLDFYKNPEHKKQAIAQFQNFSPKVQQIFLNSLVANKTSVSDLSKKFHLTPEKTLTPIELQNLKINDDAANLDTLWSAYQATGDISYPSKILEFISDNDNYVFMAAFYFVNGIQTCPPASIQKDCPWLPIKQMKKDLESRYPEQQKIIFHHMVTVASALWSMNAMRKQDTDFNQKISALCQINPKLDYLKRVFPNNKQGYWNTAQIQNGA